MLSIKQRVQKKNELNRVIPIREFGDLIRYKDGTYRQILKITDPINIDLMGTEELTKAIHSLQSVMNMLKPRQSCQILIHSDPADIEDYLWDLYGKAEAAERRGDTYIAERLRAKARYLENHRHKARNVHNFYLVLKSTSKKRDQAEQELHDLSSSVIDKLASTNINATRLKKEEINRVIYHHLAPVTSMAKPYQSSMDLMRWRPPDVRDHGTYLEMDHTYYQPYTVNYIPEKQPAGWLDTLLQARVNLDISITLTVADKSAVIKKINGKIAEYQAHQLDYLPESIKQEYEDKINSNKELLKKIRSHSENLLATTFLMVVRADSAEELKSACERFEQNVTDLQVKKVLYRGCNLLWYFLPICYRNDEVERRYHWPMPSETAAFMLPFNSSEVNFNRGILRGINVKTEAPVILDPWDQSLFFNRNEFKVGRSGSGKTWSMVVDTFREYYAGSTQRQILLDIEREFHKYFPFANRIVFSPGSDYCTNPFHIRSYVVDHDDPDQEIVDLQAYLPRKVSNMKSFFRWIYPEMSTLESAKLSEAIRRCYEAVGLKLRLPGEPKKVLKLPEKFPTLSDLDRVLAEMSGMEKFRTVLQPFVEGEYATMFSGQTNWDLSGAINILDIHDLTKDVQKPMMDLLLGEVWEEIKKNREEKMVLRIDELGLIADGRNPMTMEFCHDMAKRIRKYGGGLVVATQNITDFLSNGKWGTAILNNCEFQHFMGLKSHDIKMLTKEVEMEFSKRELEILRKDKAQGHGIFILKDRKRIEMQTECSEDEQKCLGLKKASDYLKQLEEAKKKNNVVSMVK